jgi:DNA-binding IclR family transcriptional regulator
VFAAFLPTEMTRPLIDDEFRLFRGADDKEAEQRHFEEEVAQTKLRGFARATDTAASLLPHQIAINAFSFPVFNNEGSMILALSLASPASRLDPAWDGPVPRALATAARDLSGRLGWAGD